MSVFNEIYGVASYNCQLFDSIVYHRASRILEVRADIVRGDNFQPSSAFIDEAILELVGWLRFQFSQFGVQVDLDHPINLFPSIEFFNRENDGLIGRLNFATAQGSIKRQTMKKGEDLRLEIYHQKGMEAIDHKITPFELSIFWERENSLGLNVQAEITIPSSYRVAVTSRSQYYAIISSCPTEEDSEFLLGKLLRAISHDHQANADQ